MAARPAKNRPAKPQGEGTVAEDPSKAGGPFDIAMVEALVALMSQHDLSEIELRSANQRIRLRRGALPVVSGMPALPAAPVAAPVAPALAAAPKNDAPASAPTKKLIDIKSPTPGTFYASPSPDAQPFVRAGSKVTASTVVCLIEAMKIFNEITADCNGVIAEILAENQQPVEYGQVLFRVDPTG